MKLVGSVNWAAGFVLCALLAAFFGVGVAHADDRAVPADVQRWFETSADEVMAKRIREAAEADAGWAEGTSGRVSVGTPVARLRAAADKDVEQWEGLGEWVAPLLRGDAVVGTVVVWREPPTQTVGVAVFDDNVPAGEAVATAGRDPNMRVAIDPLGKGLLLVDIAAQRVTLVELGGDSMAIADYRSSLADRIADAERRALWSPDVIGTTVIMTVALAGVGLFLLKHHRSTLSGVRRP